MVLGGAISFGILSSFVKIAYGQGFTAAELTFVQALIGAVVLWIMAIFSKKPGATLKSIPMLLFAGAAIGISTYTYYLSVQYISASAAILLLMQFTWLSILLEWVLFKRKPLKMEWLITLIILGGTVLASGLVGHKTVTLAPVGVAIVLLASLVYAIYIVANGRVAKELAWQHKSAWIMTGSTISILVLNFKSIVFQSHPGTDLLMWGVFLAFFGTLLPPVLFAIAIPRVGAATSSLLLTVELPVAIIAAHLVLHEEISGIQLLGIAVMLGAIAGMNLVKKKTIPG